MTRLLAAAALLLLAACAAQPPAPSGVPVVDPGLYHDPGNDAFCAAHPNEGTCQ